jgi:hypothetical protein
MKGVSGLNVFHLDEDPVLAARYHADRHVVKMIVESAQLLATAKAFWGETDPELYRPTHAKHPCAVWVRTSKGNYEWTFALFDALLEEYRFRYGKKHASARLRELLAAVPASMPDRGITEPALAMPAEYVVTGDAVASYRNYYRFGKAHLHQWTKRGRPAWVDAR